MGFLFSRGPIVGFFATILALYALMLLSMTALADRPTRVDYMAFYEAGRMALAGRAEAAYRWEELRPLQAALIGVPEDELTSFLGWVNPPHFFFAILPFSLLPFGWAWFAWIMACAALLAWSMRAVIPEAAGPAAVIALCAPAVFTCAAVGQNGILTAALMAWTYALMDRRPAWSGIALGLLTYKPQFGLLIPFLLLATRRWTVFAVATLTAVLAIGLALAIFGPATLEGFLANVGLNNERYLAVANHGTPRIQSVYAIVLTASGRTDIAWAVHLAFATAVAAFVLRLWLRRPEGPEESRAAAAIAASFLVTPFTWIYDAPSLVVAGAFLWRAGLRQGFLAWERLLIVLACVSTQVTSFTGPYSAIVPASWLVLLALAWRRDRAWRLSLAPSAMPS
jgi:hypothetical protein